MRSETEDGVGCKAFPITEMKWIHVETWKVELRKGLLFFLALVFLLLQDLPRK
jgi:hypothetical protein